MGIENILNSGEVVKYKAKLSFVPVIAGGIFALAFALFGLGLYIIGFKLFTSEAAGILGVLFLLLDIPIALYIIITYLVYILTTVFVVTDKRVFIRTGLFSHKYFEIPRTHISGVGIEQSLFGRIFQYGSIIIESSANISSPRARYIKYPFELKEILQILEV